MVMGKQPENGPEGSDPGAKSELTPAAKRALAEAEARRKARMSTPSGREKEVGGAEGPDPIRYGDWEKDGTISDF